MDKIKKVVPDLLEELDQAPNSAHKIVRKKWRELGPLTLADLMEKAPWALKDINWSDVQFARWNNKYGNKCIGTIAKDTSQRQHGIVRTIKPGYGMVEAQWCNGEYHGYMRWIRRNGQSGTALYMKG